MCFQLNNLDIGEGCVISVAAAEYKTDSTKDELMQSIDKPQVAFIASSSGSSSFLHSVTGAPAPSSSSSSSPVQAECKAEMDRLLDSNKCVIDRTSDPHLPG